MPIYLANWCRAAAKCFFKPQSPGKEWSKRMKRIAILVSGGGTNLQALIDASARGEIPHGEIVLVVGSKPGIGALERAEKAGIDTAVVESGKYNDMDIFDDVLLGVLLDHKIDVLVLAGYMTVLGRKVLKFFDRRILNVHPSLIPSFSGKNMYGLKVHEAALGQGVKVTGATVHLVNEIVDGGEILMQKAVDVFPGDTAETLQRRVMEEAEWVLLPKAVEMVCEELETKG